MCALEIFSRTYSQNSTLRTTATAVVSSLSINERTEISRHACATANIDHKGYAIVFGRTTTIGGTGMGAPVVETATSFINVRQDAIDEFVWYFG